jgi:hypothetical protein
MSLATYGAGSFDAYAAFLVVLRCRLITGALSN